MYKVNLLDYQISEIVAKYVRYANRWDVKDWLVHFVHRKDEKSVLFRRAVEELVCEYVQEIQRLQVCGILYGPCNDKMIDKYLWGVDEYGMSVNKEFVNRFTKIVEEYKGKGE